MKNFETSPIWLAIEGGQSFNSFCENIIPRFKFVESVPDSIKRRFGIIRKLLEFSYYEYEFIDVAKEHCYNTLELALHLKYEAKNPNKKKKMNFKPYLDWAVRNNHLNITIKQKKSLEYLRNYITHPKRDSLSGIFGLNMINIIGNELINDLFTVSKSH